MKFLLIRPGIEYYGEKSVSFSPLSHPPLGLLYLGSVLEQDGHKVEILDFYAEKFSIEKLKESLKNSDAVGISVYSNNYKSAEHLSKIIKKVNIDIPLIIGGPHCSFFPKKSLLDIPHADISVMGEGEYVILDIIQYLKGKKQLSNIHGIHYRENKSILPGKPVKVINNLDKLPYPARHLVEKYDYGTFLFGYKLKGKVTSIITSKGCSFQCRFCNRYGNLIKDWDFRKRSALDVFEEICQINEKYKSLIIVDDNFFSDIKRANNIFDMILDSKINLDILVEARVDIANKDLFLKMKKAGVKYIFYGLESGNQDVLDFYNKKITLQQIKNATELAREMNFFISASFIFGAPIETKKHIENTINFATSLPLDLVSFGPLRYVIGSSLWNEAVKNKKILSNQYSTISNSKYGLGNFTEEELIELVNKAYKIFYNRPKYILNQMYRSFLRKDLNMLTYGLKFFTMINRYNKN